MNFASIAPGVGLMSPKRSEGRALIIVSCLRMSHVGALLHRVLARFDGVLAIHLRVILGGSAWLEMKLRIFGMHPP